LPGGPVGPVSRWAATSDVEVSQTTYPVNKKKVGMDGEKGARDKFTKRRRGKEGVEERRSPETLCYGGIAVSSSLSSSSSSSSSI